MKVVLQKDVKNLGLAGDVVSVKKGYARHLLFPKKWASPFTVNSVKQARHRKIWIEAKKKKALALRTSLIEKLKGAEVFFEKESDLTGKLFGSVTAFEIAKALEKKGYEIDKKFIQLEQPVKMVGEYLIFICLGKDQKVQIKVNICSLNKEFKKEQEKKTPVKDEAKDLSE